jgi:hypothetical protein
MAKPEQQDKRKGPTLAAQAERSLKQAKNLIKEAGGDSAGGAMAEMEQARVLALLELAQAMRGTRNGAT